MQIFPRTPDWRALTGFLAAAALLAGCGAGDGATKAGGAGGKGAPIAVGYVVLQPGEVPVTAELAGRVTAYQASEVRPQVSGIIQHRLFQEGAIVRQGQLLYQIDPSLYIAQVNQATANLQSARAMAEAAQVKADRYKPLAAAQAVSQQDYTDAVAAARQAAAAVLQSQAALNTAQINLRFTKVPAPITGRIGRSLITEGGLVTNNQTDPLTTIQRLDPIYVDIQQSAADLLTLRRSLSQGGAAPASAAVRLKLEDGSDYGLPGVVQFSEVVVNQATGTVTLRASFPNPQGLLLPGMFVRALLVQSVDPAAYRVPQPALSRDPNGEAFVWVVGPDNKAVRKIVNADRTEGANWVVTAGLNPGDKVIVQGTGNMKPGAKLKPVPADTPQKVVAPKPGGGGQSGGSGAGGGQGGSVGGKPGAAGNQSAGG